MFESMKNARQPRRWPVRRILVSVVVIGAVLGMRALTRAYEKQKRDELNAAITGDGLRWRDPGAAPIDPPAAAAPAPPEPDLARKRSEETATAAATAMAPVQLPGMSVELPGLHEVTGDYRVGEAGGPDAGRWPVLIAWRPGELPSDDQFEADLRESAAEWIDVRTPPGSPLSPTADRSDRVRELRLDGNPVRQGTVRSHRFSFYLLVGTCGGRRIELSSASPELTERLRASFRCHPDPAQERAVRDVPVRLAVAERAGWQRIAPRSGLVLAEADRVRVRLDELAIVANADFEQRVSRWGIKHGYNFRRRARPTGDHVVWDAESFWNDDPRGLAAVVAWRCPATHVVGAAWISLDGGGTDPASGIDLAMTGRCLAEGERYPAQLAAPAEHAKPTPRSQAR